MDVEEVQITEPPQEEIGVAELKALLKRFFGRLGSYLPGKCPVKVDDDMGLQEWIGMARKYGLSEPVGLFSVVEETAFLFFHGRAVFLHGLNHSFEEMCPPCREDEMDFL